jgi:PPOX class probable F420-dependent enzyme
MAVATIGRDGFAHVVAMWYVLLDGKPAFWTYAKSQKAVNLRRDPKVTCLIEAGEAYDELRGVQIKRHATLIDDPADVLRLGETIWERYTGGPLDDAMRQMVAAQRASASARSSSQSRSPPGTTASSAEHTGAMR